MLLPRSIRNNKKEFGGYSPTGSLSLPNVLHLVANEEFFI